MAQQPSLNIWQRHAARLQAAHRVAVDAVLGDPIFVDSQGRYVRVVPAAPSAASPMIIAADTPPLSPTDSESIGPLTQSSVASEAQVSAADARSQQSSNAGASDAEAAAPLTPLVRRNKRKAG